jgi:hypothetical protein
MPVSIAVLAIVHRVAMLAFDGAFALARLAGDNEAFALAIFAFDET